MLPQPFFQGKEQGSIIFQGKKHLYFFLPFHKNVPFLIQLNVSKKPKTSQESIYLISGQ